MKWLLICFLAHGIVHHKFVPPGLTVNQHFYTIFCNVHRKACDRNSLRGGMLGISFSIKAVRISDSVLSVQQFLTNNGMTVAPHSQHFPCLAPYNIYGFLKLR